MHYKKDALARVWSEDQTGDPPALRSIRNNEGNRLRDCWWGRRRDREETELDDWLLGARHGVILLCLPHFYLGQMQRQEHMLNR